MHQSWYQVASVFVFSVIPAVIYYIFIYAYYRQTITPNHPACLINTYGDEHRHHRSAPSGGMVACSQVGYAPMAGMDNGVYTRSRNGMTTSRLEHAQNLLSPRRRPAQVPKSLRGVNTSSSSSTSSTTYQVGIGGNKKPPFVSRSLKRDRRPPPLIQSPSPIGLSPGPPSYGPSRVYAAFAAPVPSEECDNFL